MLILIDDAREQIAPVVALELPIKARMFGSDLTAEDNGNLGARDTHAICKVVLHQEPGNAYRRLQTLGDRRDASRS